MAAASLVYIQNLAYDEMMKVRSIPASQARARFGALLESLELEGPVNITRHGCTIGLLSPKASKRPSKKLLAQIAGRYSSGELSWGDIQNEIDLDFGSLLVELGRQNLSFLKTTGDKSTAQLNLFHHALDNGRKKTKDADE